MLSSHIESLENLLNIFLFILVGDFNILAVGLQINGDRLSKPLIFSRKRILQDSGNIIIAERDQYMKVRVTVNHTRSNLDFGESRRLHLPCPLM